MSRPPPPKPSFGTRAATMVAKLPGCTDLPSQGHGLRNQCWRVATPCSGVCGSPRVDVENAARFVEKMKPDKPLRTYPCGGRWCRREVRPGRVQIRRGKMKME